MGSAITTDQLQRARHGSNEALDDLVGRCSGRLLALIRLRMGPSLRRRLESRDVLQNTWLKALGAIEHFDGDSRESLMAWLGRIAVNEINDQAEFHGRQRRDARKEVPVDAAPGELVAQVRTATARVALGEQARTLELALEQLEEHQREVIVLRKLEELSFREVGERMGRSEDACRMLFARAMTALTLAASAVAASAAEDAR